MLPQLLRFEVLYQSKQRALPIAGLVFFCLGYFLGKSGNAPALVDFNAPFQVSYFTGNMSLMSVFIIMFFAVSGVIRDSKDRMEALIYSTAVKKADFFWSRFIGVFLFSVFAFSLFLPGFLMGVSLSGLDAARIAPFQWQTYLWPFLVIMVPNIFICTSVLFSVSLLSKRNVATYAAAILMYLLYFIIGIYSNSPMFASSIPASAEQMTRAALADPFAISTFFEHTQFWTPFDKSNLPMSFSGNYIWNRLLWIGFSFVLLGFTYRLFSFRKTGQQRRQKPSLQLAQISTQLYRSTKVLINRRTQWRAFGHSVKMDIFEIIQSLPFLAVLFTLFAALAFELYLKFFAGGFPAESWHPFTHLVIESVIEIIPILSKILIVFYSGELIWKAQDRKFDGILNATPTLNWVFFLSKMVTLTLLPMLLITTLTVVCIAFQLVNGFMVIDLKQYLLLFYHYGISIVTWSSLAIFVQSLAKHKYLGMGLTGFVLLALTTPLSYHLGLEHPMLRIGVMPSITYSNMAGYGIQVSAFTTYACYWVALGIILALFSLKYWNRQLIEARRDWARIWEGQWKRSELLALSLSLMGFMAAGIVLYHKLSTDGQHESRAAQIEYREQYERKFKQYEVLPKLTTGAIQTEIDIYPEDQRYSIAAEYQLVNRNGIPVQQLFLSTTKKLSAIRLENANLISEDTVFGTYLFEFEQPIQPQETTSLRYELTHQSLPFKPDHSILRNGVYLRHEFFEPILAYDRSRELSDPLVRRSRGLPDGNVEPQEGPENSVVPIEDQDISFETIISTSANQEALAPGDLIKKWSKDGRNFYRYQYSERSIAVIAYLSAQYEVKKHTCDGVELKSYYHPEHDINLPTIEATACATLSYGRENFGPYPFQQLRVAEIPSYFPRAGDAQPGIISLVEDKVYLIDIGKNNSFNLAAKRTAEQVAHQWWGISLTPKNAPGAGFLTFGLAKYTAAVVLEEMYGQGALWEINKTANEQYFRGRAFASAKEPPLYREQGKRYLINGKSSLVLSSLRDLIGEEKFNAALRKLLDKYAPSTAHEVHILDFIDELYAVSPQEHHTLIDDWMKQIIRYELSVDDIQYKRLDNGQYEISAAIFAKRFKTLPSGREIAIDINEPIKIGCFNKHPKSIGKTDKIPYLETHCIQDTLTTIKLTLDSLPRYITVDPFLTRPDRNYANNLKEIVQ
ncbi:MAG: hypothetical protein HRU41_26765 [Saprospiraceae bacterium]|nr:hypothetical protein [Saprospiraceae bacterium]